jgi:hypothetical protein
LNSIIQSLADVDNLLALLALAPEVTDREDAIPLSIKTASGQHRAGLSIQFEGR